MNKVVFILGAGASADGGAPVMADFLDRARDLYFRGAADLSREDFDAVFKAVGSLQQTHSKSKLDIRNLESIWTAFEMAELVKAESLLDGAAPLTSLRRLIVQTLCRTTTPDISNDFKITTRGSYGAFADLISELEFERQPSLEPAIITFNYDVLLDLALTTRKMSAWYGLEGDRPGNMQQPVLKLHGSINWRTTESNDGDPTIVSADLKGIVDRLKDVHSLGHYNDPTEIFRDLPAALKKWNLAEGIHYDEFDPVIVPPTWDKGKAHAALTRVWQVAAKRLREADHIVVIGYSLPETDAFFRNFYSVATVGPEPLQSFLVYDKAPSGGPVEARFRDLLGPGATDVFEYIPKPFSEALDDLQERYMGNVRRKTTWGT